MSKQFYATLHFVSEFVRAEMPDGANSETHVEYSAADDGVVVSVQLDLGSFTERGVIRGDLRKGLYAIRERLMQKMLP